jgi:hypothetical protein
LPDRESANVSDNENKPYWIEPADSPWGVRVLDVRPFSQSVTAWSEDPSCAQNAISFRGDDGSAFIGVAPEISRTVLIGLRYRADGFLADGVLFAPDDMDEKWAIFVHHGRIIFVRSWRRSVVAVASTRMEGEFIEITEIEGVLTGDQNETPDLTVRMLHALLFNHGLDLTYPLPIPPGMDADIDATAKWCYSLCGRRAAAAASDPLPLDPPDTPLRSNSLLHIAVAQGDREKVRAQVEAGLPIDLLAKDGLSAMHWACTRPDNAMFELLLELGMPVDVRSDEGATALMNIAQNGSVDKGVFLLDRGADVNAVDGRGFTGLHRCAEVGNLDMVRLLLDHGANPHIEANGHTARSLAESRERPEVVALLVDASRKGGLLK